MARLQTFPDDYEIAGGWTAGVRQLGNAVPSALGEALARGMAEQFFGRSPYPAPLTLAPEQRAEAPEPEPVQPVAVSYRSLAGDHPDHPGTGKGPAARLRAGAD